MDKIINNGIPHVLELIFESINTPGLVICLDVSQTWRELAKKILIKRRKGKIKPGPACRKGKIRIVRLVLERCNTVFKMTTVINSGIPNVGEIIFEDIDTPELIKCMEVSKPWKVLAENVLIKRWKGEMYEACQNGETKVVQLLLECCSPEESGVNIKDTQGGTTLMIACENGHKDAVQLFLEHSKELI